MKRSLATLAIVPIVAIGLVASPASAAKPIPDIKSTSQYQALKSYVQTLQVKRNTPATQVQKDAFTATLNAKQSSANAKAEALYQMRVNRITRKLNRKVSKRTVKIRERRADEVAALKEARAAKLRALAAWKNNHVNSINNQYDNAVKPLQDKIDKLQKRLNKATNPAKRQSLQTQIEQLQDQIKELTSSKESDLQAIGTRYAARVENTKERYADKIEDAKAAAAKQIAQVKRQIARQFKDDMEHAKDVRTADLALITGLRDQGANYIAQMPLAGG